MQWNAHRTAVIGLGLTTVGLIIALLGLVTGNLQIELFGAKEPKLELGRPVPRVADSFEQVPIDLESWRPLKSGGLTNVHFRNKGLREALVEYVEFEPESRFKTPLRQLRFEQGPTILVVFSIDDSRADSGTLRYVLPMPKAAPGDGQWTTLKVGILAPNHPGWTYRGRLTAHFADGGQLSAANVELDILDKLQNER
jgi:hypothetical protein